MKMSTHYRFWRNVIQGENGCWTWNAGKFESGYGAFKIKGKTIKAHRFAWAEIHGPLPKWQYGQLELDHKVCDNRACVRPSHLALVTHQMNMVRGDGLIARYAKRTHCSKGHLLQGNNLRIRVDGGRRCIVCEKEYSREFYIKRKS